MSTSEVRRGSNYRYDALYYDIVPDQRIVYSYEMYAAQDPDGLAAIVLEALA